MAADKTWQLNIAFVVVAFLVLIGFQVWLGVRDFVEIPYSEFLARVEAADVADLTVTPTVVTGRLRTPLDGHNQFVTRRVDDGIAGLLRVEDIGFTGAEDSTWLGTLLSWVVPVLVMFGPWIMVFRSYAERQGFGGAMAVGKSRAKVFVQVDTGVTFADVAGVDEAKAELQEVVAFLHDKDRYGRLSAHVPKGQAR